MSVSIARARTDFADLINRAAYGKERIVLNRHGKNVCAIVPMESLRALEALEKLEDAADRKVLPERRREASIPWNKAKKALSKPSPRKSAR
jgi:prevent-host-death family protein